MGWWVADPADRGSGVRLGLLAEPHVQPILHRLPCRPAAAIAISTDGGRSDGDFVAQLNIAGSLMEGLGGTLYDPQQDAVLTDQEALSRFASTRVVQYFNQRERFDREVDAATASRDALGSDTLWEPDDRAMEEIIRENRGLMGIALGSLALLLVFIVMAVNKSCT
jgi:hypothetical protein